MIDYGYYENESPFYEIEFYPYSNLSELYVFGKNEPFVWHTIISEILNSLKFQVIIN